MINFLLIFKTATIAPSGKYPSSYPPWIPNWLDLNVMVPFIATCIVVAVGILVICVAYNKRRGDSGPNSKDVYCMFGRNIIELIGISSKLFYLNF
jgi:hypothetical protein